MEKGVLICGADENKEFDCTLDGNPIEIHTIMMKNGHFTNMLLDPDYRKEYVRGREEESRAKARAAVEKRRGFKVQEAVTVRHIK